MRMMVATALMLTACGQGSAFDEGFKKSFREKGVESCATSARRSAPTGTTVDFEKLCGCVTDKIMAGKSASELMNYQPGAKDREYIAQCAADLGIKPGG